jgi:hypothetical protein
MPGQSVRLGVKMNHKRIDKAAAALARMGFSDATISSWRQWVADGCGYSHDSGKRDSRRWAHYTRRVYSVKGF